jgi:hypothetical protein
MQQWETAFPGGCVFSAVSAELDDQPGPARDYLVEVQNDYHDVVKRAAQIAIDTGEFRKDLDPAQFAFEFGSITAAYHHFGRLLGDPRAEKHAYNAFEALLARSH